MKKPPPSSCWDLFKWCKTRAVCEIIPLIRQTELSAYTLVSECLPHCIYIYIVYICAPLCFRAKCLPLMCPSVPCFWSNLQHCRLNILCSQLIFSHPAGGDVSVHTVSPNTWEIIAVDYRNQLSVMVWYSWARFTRHRWLHYNNFVTLFHLHNLSHMKRL